MRTASEHVGQPSCVARHVSERPIEAAMSVDYTLAQKGERRGDLRSKPASGRLVPRSLPAAAGFGALDGRQSAMGHSSQTRHGEGVRPKPVLASTQADDWIRPSPASSWALHGPVQFHLCCPLPSRQERFSLTRLSRSQTPALEDVGEGQI